MRSLKAILRVCIAVTVCWQGLSAAPAWAQEKVVLVGSGSNVPLRLYQVWINDFNKSNPRVQVEYLPLGTSESIQQISEGSGDFGGGEVPLTNEQMHGPKVTLLQIPTVLVGIVPIYNLPGQPELNFSGELLAQIYLGTVKNWRDARIAKLNPEAKLPDLPISVVHRSPGKGSNYIFSDFLSKMSAEFRSQVGKNPSPRWPVGVDTNRGEDMVEKVVSARGAIGYVELNFARNAGIGYGRVQNAAGHFVRATPASIAAACAAIEKSITGNFQVSMTNAPGKDSYPISSFTWIYVPTSRASGVRGHALKQFLNWALQGGQGVAKGLGYATLPDEIVSKARQALNALQ
jgi:phosphate transport system substrate-binding protein